MYRRGPVGCGKHEVMRRAREGGYYSILRLIRERGLNKYTIPRLQLRNHLEASSSV